MTLPEHGTGIKPREAVRGREMNDRAARPQTVVDYDAWNRGYMPPSEHVLIDKLAYRGARVQLSTAVSRDHQVWVVIEGPPLTNKQRKALRDMVNLWFEDEPDEPKTVEPQTDTGSVT